MYGFSLLHDSNSKDSYIHHYKLKNIIETLDDQQNTIDMLSSVVEELASRQHPCGGTGWVKIVDLDMANPSHTCPTGWQETGYSKRTCGRVSTGTQTCDPASFSVGMCYSKVCGRIAAYQVGNTNGFSSYIQDTTTELTENYADGVALYYGTPAEHIWTFVAGTSETRIDGQQVRRFCPCDRDPSDSIDLPDFMGSNYFCESMNEGFDNSDPDRFGIYAEDVLWDGQNCLTSSNCCEFNRPPYFVKVLPESTTENIVASICLRNNPADIAVEIVEIYVHE